MPIMKKNYKGQYVLSEVADEQAASTPEALFFKEETKECKTDIPCPFEDITLFRDRVDTTKPPEVDPTEYVSYPVVKEAFAKNFDLSDNTTRKTILSLTEANQNTVLTNLTSKLYDHIVKKTTKIDYGKIPQTKGDITKMQNYEEIKDILGILQGILKEYNEKGGPVETIALALTNLETRKDLFERAYRADCQLPCMIYENTALAIVEGTSYLISACIELVKAPADETFKIQLDKVGYQRTRSYLLYTTLEKFNKACEKGEIDEACNHIISQRVKKFSGVATAGVIIGVVVVLNIVPILRELVYLFYHSRVKASDFFAIQADLLQMNAYNVEANATIDSEKRKQIVEKQMKIVDSFRDYSNKLAIDSKQCEVNASREIQSSEKKFKLDDDKNIVDTDISQTSSLF